MKFDFSAKEVQWSFNRRPQRTSRRIGASDPPLYSCKKLESNLKKAVPTIPWFNPDFTAKTQFPPSKADESTPFLGKNLNQKSPLKMQNQSKIPNRPCS